MVHTVQNLKTLNLNPDFEFQQLGSLKHVINIIVRIRDTGCYTAYVVVREDGRVSARWGGQ
jgi:hypothetical protein